MQKQSTYFHATVSWAHRQVFVYNMSTHGLLDSKIYKCNSCNNSFSGCSAESMKQDRTGIVAAVFNIRFVGNFAMGLELYRCIVGCKSLTPTQSIVAELEAAYMLNYEDVVCEYLSCLRTDRNVPASTNREQPILRRFQKHSGNLATRTDFAAASLRHV